MSYSTIRPGESAVSVTPDDATTFAPTRALYVGTSGNVKVTTANGEDVTFNAVAAGVLHPLRVVRVYATGTTAADVVAIY